MPIKFVLMVNKQVLILIYNIIIDVIINIIIIINILIQGQTRLASYYEWFPIQERVTLEAEVSN